MRLRELDVRVSIHAPLRQEELKRLNAWTFIVSEAVRLPLREIRPEANCVKLLIQFMQLAEGIEGSGPYVVDGICEVVLPVDLRTMLDASDLGPIVAATRLGVQLASSELGEGGAIIGELLDRIERSTPPCEFKFFRLTKFHRQSGTEFTVWFRADMSSFDVVVDCDGPGGRKSVVVFSSRRPLYLEDDFPMKDSLIRGNEFIIRDRDKRTLARVPVVLPQ